ALGSCAELETQLLIANELSFVKNNTSSELQDLVISEIKQINALKRQISKSL
ncbi:MAG TPA: four helix bundle protein, partial [candidate division Zixibacteria bacterium]|nr:four helix bundle protein [candidate division Zixibacteria bacterium]